MNISGSGYAFADPNTATPPGGVPGVETQVGEMLDWFSRPPAKVVGVELAETHAHICALSALQISITQFHRLVDLFEGRVRRVAAAVRLLLRDAPQPLGRDLRLLAQRLDDLEARVCDAYMRVLKDIELRFAASRRRDPSPVATQALHALRERQVIAAFIAEPAPHAIWLQAQHLYRVSCRARLSDAAAGDAGSEAGRVYREMLAFAAIQPERLSVLEVVWASDYLARFAAAVTLLDRPPEATDRRAFWIDPALGGVPVALRRRVPPAGSDAPYFSCSELGALAAEQLRELEAGTDPAQLRLPPEAATPAYRSLLAKLHDSWTSPAMRHLVRRNRSYRVVMHIGLDALTRLFEAPRLQAGGGSMQSDWTVLNESPSGFRLAHAAGDIGGLQPGAAVALRAASDRPWDLCVVRWVRNEQAERTNIGLQILASSAQTVQLAFRHPRAPRSAVTALRLPSLRTLRAHDAVLAPCGTATSERFVMVAENGRTQVTQGRIVNHDLRTTCVELFQFQHDPGSL